MIEVKAPYKFSSYDQFSIFLAGSIEMGTAVDWQLKVCEDLKEYDVLLLNPRRDDWDASWIQSIENEEFKDQVEWELEAMEFADLVILNLVPGTKSPISLMELGLYAHSGKLVVCCPKTFYRRGNVEIVCSHYHIPMTSNFESLVSIMRNRAPHLKDLK